MIIVLKQDAPKEKVHEFCTELEGMGLQINDSKGSDTHILGLIGDTKAIAESWVLANPVVETCRRVSEPYKKANRKFHPDDSVIDVEGVKIGGGSFAVIAGPCSIESEEQITYCAQRVKAAGASLLRGGAFKPRTSPYSFQGMRSEGLDLLKLARRATGSPIVTEIMNTEHLPLFENVDLIQVGARNMQNFELLKAVGRQKKPVLLKRGLANTLEEFVMSAEYIMAEGNENVILCERGIRTFETSMRNTLDLAGVVMLHKMTHLPVIVDPSHACGHAWMVPQLAKAAVAAGADGLMIEVHNDPAKAKEIALSMYNRGADFVQHIAGASGMGVFTAAKEADRYAFGVGGNQNYIEPDYIVATALRDVNTIVYNEIKALVEGTWEPGVHISGIAEGSVGFDNTDSNVVLPDDIAAAVEDIKAKITAGELVPCETAEELDAWVAANQYQPAE